MGGVLNMSTEYSIYRFAKPTKQELSKIEFFEPYSMFPVYDADDEQTNEHICLFCCDDKDITNIINSKFARRVVLPEKATDYENLYRSMGFGEKEIAEKRVYLKSSDGYTMDYTDGMQLIRVAYNELKKYRIVVQTECVAIKMECLWNSEDVYCYPDKTRVYEYIPALKEFSYAPITNNILAKAEIPFMIFERNKGKCFIKKY